MAETIKAAIRHRAVGPRLVCTGFCLAALVGVLVPTNSVLVGAVFAEAQEAAPKQKTKRNAKKQKQSEESNNLEEGIVAVDAGRYQDAVKLLTNAIDSGSLKFKDTARALYYRGKAYRHLEQPAQAISDLTSALWKPGALEGEERKGAMAEREAAYRGAGHDPQAVAAAPEQPARPSATPTPQAAAARPSAEAERKPQGGQWTTQAAPPPAQQQTAKSGGNFFTNLFGGGSTASASSPANSPPAAKPPAIAPVAAVGPATQPARTPERQGMASSWSTTPTAGGAQRGEPTEAPQQAVRAPSGGLRIKVASVRSKADAETIARQIQQRHTGLLGARHPSIEQAVLGNMGTMYQVNVGPYRTPQETQRLCSKLLEDGLDCLVLGGN